ncbi:hypothetical protein [Edaphobacter modestus]|uniref:Uncharacterized protein n=1 Tax=Edaphobacter modestus TaxID=388466 RepID=A0A4Q7YRI2_9BACT|nr:hypothetical protein [Edaphobacter modestus]RZU40317.1 hypothetical protein BDD14_1763 [Edaphobacter modestus]
MTRMRNYILLAALGILVATAQLVATRWGLAGDLAGGFLSGVLLLAGTRVLMLEIEKTYLLPIVAAVASLSGLAFAMAGSDVATPHIAWVAPLLAALPTGMTALVTGMRGRKCQLCRTPLRRFLSFCCPRCHMVACENCWQFERDRCRLCEANQIPLFPIDISWWQQCFGTQVHGGRCTLCLRAADGRVAQWACAGCGYGQCRSCWDDNNGQCSRCGWIIPDLPPEVSTHAVAGAHPQTISRSIAQEDSPHRNADRKEVRNG